MTGATANMNTLILELRAKTGAGMTDCKKALMESSGNLEAALISLRKKGLADAAKKSGRITKEGAVAYWTSPKAGALVELNCETDFVARTPEFQALAQTLAEKFGKGELKTAEDAKPLVQPAFEKMGENMSVRRFERFTLTGPGGIYGYIHLGAKKGALIELSTSKPEASQSQDFADLAKELLLQVVAASPRYLQRSDVPAAEIEKEKEIYAEQLRKEGKPESALPKIIEGKVNKLFFQALCLMEQLSVRDNKTPVASLVKGAATALGADVAVKRFARYQLGE